MTHNVEISKFKNSQQGSYKGEAREDKGLMVACQENNTECQYNSILNAATANLKCGGKRESLLLMA